MLMTPIPRLHAVARGQEHSRTSTSLLLTIIYRFLPINMSGAGVPNGANTPNGANGHNANGHNANTHVNGPHVNGNPANGHHVNGDGHNANINNHNANGHNANINNHHANGPEHAPTVRYGPRPPSYWTCLLLNFPMLFILWYAFPLPPLTPGSPATRMCRRRRSQRTPWGCGSWERS